MFKLFCVVFTMIPFYGMYADDHISGSCCFWCMLATAFICMIQTFTREGRTPIYEMFTRASFVMYFPALFFWFIMSETTSCYSFWAVHYYTFTVTGTIFLALWLLSNLINGAMGGGEDGLDPFLDHLPGPINPHGVNGDE